jgi:hypothetical protein
MHPASVAASHWSILMNCSNPIPKMAAAYWDYYPTTADPTWMKTVYRTCWLCMPFDEAPEIPAQIPADQQACIDWHVTVRSPGVFGKQCSNSSGIFVEVTKRTSMLIGGAGVVIVFLSVLWPSTASPPVIEGCSVTSRGFADPNEFFISRCSVTGGQADQEGFPAALISWVRHERVEMLFPLNNELYYAQPTWKGIHEYSKSSGEIAGQRLIPFYDTSHRQSFLLLRRVGTVKAFLLQMIYGR